MCKLLRIILREPRRNIKLGQVTSIEFRQAQINLINAKTAVNNAKFDAKLIELHCYN